MTRSSTGPIILVALLLLASGLLRPVPTAVGAMVDEVRWYELRIAGEVCGWTRIRESGDSLGGRTIEEEMSLRLRRAGRETLVRTSHRETIGADGRLASMSRIDRQGDRKVETTWSFSKDAVQERRVAGERIETRSCPPASDDCVHASGLLARAAEVLAVDEEMTFHVIGPTSGCEPVPRHLVALPASDEHPGHRRWEVREPEAPVMIVLADDSGRIVQARTSLGPGLGDLEMVGVDRVDDTVMTEAGFDLDGRGALVPRIAASVGRPDRGTSLCMRLRVAEGALPKLFDTGTQKVLPDEDGVIVSVDLEHRTPFDGDSERWLSRTDSLEIDDPEIVRFASRAVPADASDRIIAWRLRRAVHRHVRDKSHRIGFTTAGQTVRSRAGDCTEHALLLAAALRVHGVPSRLVSGLIWTPASDPGQGQFVWHMWVQAVIDGGWCDLDPTLDESTRRHPAYIAVAVSDGTERDARLERAAILGLFGRGLEIDVVGRGVTVGDDR